MDQPQERKYSFQTRVFTNARCNAAYIPGMPTMSAPRSRNFETVAGFIIRYNESRKVWEHSASSGKQVKLGITKDNLHKLNQLEIPKGVNPDSWIKPSEDWFKENSKAHDYWEIKINNFRGGEEIIEAKALSDVLMNDPDSDVIHVTQHEKNPGPDRIVYILEPTLGNGPSQPVLPSNRAQQSVQPSLNTAGFLLAKPNPNLDLQRHSKLNDDPINPSTSSSTSQSSIKNGVSQSLPQSNDDQEIVDPAAKTVESSSVAPEIKHRRSRSVLNDDPINPNTSSLMPSQTPPGDSNPSSATQCATTGPVHGSDSSTNGRVNR